MLLWCNPLVAIYAVMNTYSKKKTCIPMYLFVIYSTGKHMTEEYSYNISVLDI